MTTLTHGVRSTQKPPGAAVAHGLLFLALMMLPAVVTPISQFPARLVFPPLLYLAVVAAVPFLRHTASWLRIGETDVRSAAWAALIALVSCSALIAWHAIVRPDLRFFTRYFPAAPSVQMVGIGLCFAAVNASVEELAWRGVIMDALHVRVGLTGALMVQAVGFGLAHAAGIPGGALGMLLATMYGLLLGLLRIRTGGLLLCIVSHFFADATIFTLAMQHR